MFIFALCMYIIIYKLRKSNESRHITTQETLEKKRRENRIEVHSSQEIIFNIATAKDCKKGRKKKEPKLCTTCVLKTDIRQLTITYIQHNTITSKEAYTHLLHSHHTGL